jgi:AAA family ATP:ADP antiporter
MVEQDRSAPGLVPAMVCISLSAACLVGGYEFARSTVASLFIEAFGTGPMPYAMTMVPVLMVVLIYSYGRILTRLGSLWTLQVSLGFSAAAFGAAYLALRTGSKPAVAAIYVFTEAYIVILVEQFWSFINSTLDQSRAKAFNGPILGGASVGPVLAGLALNRFAAVLGSEQFVLLAGLALLPAAVLAYAAYRLAGEPQPSAAERGVGPGPLRLRLILDHKVLLFIAGVVALSQFFAAATNLRLYELLEAAMPNKDARSAYLGSFWAMVNGLAFLMQFVATPLVLRRLPLAAILIGIPLVHTCTAGLMLAHPSLTVAAAALLIFKGIDYSVFRASKELLYIPLPFDARYRAKQVVDAFNYRFSKGAAAGGISLAKSLLGTLPGWAYPAISLAAAGAWVAAAVPLARKAQEGASTA